MKVDIARAADSITAYGIQKTISVKSEFIDNINLRSHSKASELYVDATFHYKDVKEDISIPFVYRRTGTELLTSEAIGNYIVELYDALAPQNRTAWLEKQVIFWQTMPRASVTKPFFEALSTFRYTCVSCGLPKNTNTARRIQALKEFGYTLATNTKIYCKKCDKNCTHHALVPIPRGGLHSYETWTPETRHRILRVLGNFDAYEAKVIASTSLLPDHKFPEIRWDAETRRETLKNLSDDEIKLDFQLLNNQRNQQKREVCRNCYQTDKRGIAFGIKYFYDGDESWPKAIPKKGKGAEPGCVGCPWYDLAKWRGSLIKKLP